MRKQAILFAVLAIAIAGPVFAQLSPAADFAVHVANQYQIASNVTYRTAGPNKQAAPVRWFGDLPNKMEIAKRVSPLTYVRAGLPPILTIREFLGKNGVLK